MSTPFDRGLCKPIPQCFKTLYPLLNPCHLLPSCPSSTYVTLLSSLIHLLAFLSQLQALNIADNAAAPVPSPFWASVDHPFAYSSLERGWSRRNFTSAIRLLCSIKWPYFSRSPSLLHLFPWHPNMCLAKSPLWTPVSKRKSGQRAVNNRLSCRHPLLCSLRWWIRSFFAHGQLISMIFSRLFLNCFLS